MPIIILEYIAVGSEVWRLAAGRRRLVARCASKSVARRIARLLNEELGCN